MSLDRSQIWDQPGLGPTLCACQHYLGKSRAGNGQWPGAAGPMSRLSLPGLCLYHRPCRGDRIKGPGHSNVLSRECSILTPPSHPSHGQAPAPIQQGQYLGIQQGVSPPHSGPTWCTGSCGVSVRPSLGAQSAPLAPLESWNRDQKAHMHLLEPTRYSSADSSTFCDLSVTPSMGLYPSNTKTSDKIISVV